MAGVQADLRSVASIEALATTMAAAPAAIDGALREAEDALSPRLRGLERALEHARDSLRRAERRLEDAERAAYSSDNGRDADHGAVAAAQASVDEAQALLHRMENAFADVQTALGRYKSAAAGLSATRSGTVAQGVAYLSERVMAAHEYLALQASASSSHSAGGASAPDAPERPLATRAVEAVLHLSTAAQLVTGMAYDVTSILDERRANLSPDQQTQQLVDLLDGAEGVALGREAEEAARKRQIDVAVKADASPQVTLFDPEIGRWKDGLF